MGEKTATAALPLELTLYQVVWCTVSTLSTAAQADGRVHLAYMDSQGGGVG